MTEKKNYWDRKRGELALKEAQRSARQRGQRPPSSLAEAERRREGERREHRRQAMAKFLQDHVVDHGTRHRIEIQFSAAVHAIALDRGYAIYAATEGGAGEIDFYKIQPRKLDAWSGWGKLVRGKYKVRIIREAHEWDQDFTRPIWTLEIVEDCDTYPFEKPVEPRRDRLTVLDAFERAEAFVINLEEIDARQAASKPSA